MRTVLEVDGLFDGTDTMSDAAIVIDGGEIAWVGKRSRAPKTPKGERSRTVEAATSFVVPGMVNAHAHLTVDGSANFDAEIRQSDTMATVKAFKNARAAMRAGVTTVRDLGAAGTMVIELARAIESGVVEGPRIVAAGRGITTTGGHGFEVGRICDGIDEIKKGIREQIVDGAQVIKLFSTGGVLGAGAPPDVSQYSLEETRAAVSEAHKAGVKITTHAHGAEGMRLAAEAGIDSIEHATLLDAATLRVIKEHGTTLIPTFCALRSILDNADKLGPVVVERSRNVSDKHREGMRAAHKMGVRIAAGTDAGTPFNLHERFARELGYLVETGLTRTEALAAATRVSADVIGRPKAGRIAAGAWADLVFVEGDPTRDIELMLSPRAVWMRGVPVAP